MPWGAVRCRGWCRSKRSSGTSTLSSVKAKMEASVWFASDSSMPTSAAYSLALFAKYWPCATQMNPAAKPPTMPPTSATASSRPGMPGGMSRLTGKAITKIE